MASANRLKVPDPGELVIVQLRFVEQSRRLNTSILVIANSDVLGGSRQLCARSIIRFVGIIGWTRFRQSQRETTIVFQTRIVSIRKLRPETGKALGRLTRTVAGE
jgi:hypothetical protein